MFSSVELALASSSPRRMQLLDGLDIAYRHCPVDVDESCHDDEKPADYVARVASAKARAAVRQYQLEIPVLAADTAVVIGAEILGKPSDKRHARQMLKQLSGNRHTVFTGIVLVNSAASRTIVDQSEVWFDRLSPELLEAYLDSGEFDGKAGAYAIQGKAQVFIRRLEGSFSGVMGLPLHALASLLEWAGVRAG